MQHLNRFAYDIAGQQGCLQANENRIDETTRDIDCINRTQAARVAYEDYRQARESLGDSP